MTEAAWSARRALLCVMVAAIVVRIGTALYLGDTASPVSGAFDQRSYDALARRVLGGHGFSFPSPWYPFTKPGEPTAHWSYLYTLYLAGVYAVAGHHPLVARLIQAVVAGLGCWLTYLIGRRLFDERAGLTASALHGLYAYFVFFAAALMTQTFYILALLAIMVQVLSVRERPGLRSWMVLGVLLGFGTLLRQTLLLFAPVLLAWCAWRTPRPLRWRGPLVSAVGVAAMVLPWTAYNYGVFGDFLLLNSNGGFWLYSSNHPTQGAEFDPNHVAPLPSYVHQLSEPAADRALYREALAEIAAEPGRFLRLCLSRVPQYFAFLPSAQSSPVSNLARLCSFTLYLPFMLWGLLLSRRRWRLCMPIYLYLGFDTALHLASWVAPRYRLPSDALMIVFAGLAVSRLALPGRWPVPLQRLANQR